MNAPAPAPRRPWLTPTLAIGVLAFALLVGFALWVATGVDTTVRVEDRRALTTFEKLRPHTGDLPFHPALEQVTKKQLRDLACELRYTYDDTAGSGLLIDHLITRTDDAPTSFNDLTLAAALYRAQGLTEEPLGADLRWGDQSQLTLIRRDDQPVGFRYLARRGDWIQQLIIGGGSFTAEAFEAVVNATLDRFDKAPPCGG